MITGGTWEMAMYPHLPVKYLPKHVVFTYFMRFNDETLQCEIVHINNSIFTYIHRKTTPIQNEDKDIIYELAWDNRPNHIRNMRHSSLSLNKKIAQFFVDNKVFYQDNEVGEIVRNYLVQWGHDTIS